MRCPRLAGLVVVASAGVLSPAVHARHCPNVMFVVSKSGSMAKDPNGNGNAPSCLAITSKAVLATAVSNPGYLLGLELFSSSGNNAMECYADTHIWAPLAPGGGALLRQALQGVGAGGGTNLGDAIRRAVEDGGLVDPRRDNILLVVTSNVDNCHPGAPGMDYALAQVTAAADRNPPIKTAIIAWDTGMLLQELSALAVAGGFAGNCNPGGNKPCYVRATAQGIVTDMANIIGACDDTCFGNPDDCAPGQICTFPAPNVDPTCAPDPCLNKTCGAGQYCRQGECVDVCPHCPAGRYCIDGACIPDRCEGATWNQGLQYCDPEQGVMTSKCTMNLRCPVTTHCDPATGACAEDPCSHVTCPPGSACNPSGWCEAEAPPPDLAPAPDLAAPVPDAARQPELSTGGCSCAVAGGGARGLGDALAILLALATLVSRRRAR